MPTKLVDPGWRTGYPPWIFTYGLVLKVSHGLLQLQRHWGSWAADAQALVHHFTNIAVINLNKRGGTSQNYPPNLRKAAAKWGDLVSAQVSALKPEIVIAVGSSPYLPDLAGWLLIRERHTNRAPQRAFYERIINHPGVAILM